MPEVYCELGEILTVPYTTPTTLEVPHALADPIRNHDCLILERHGSITMGETLDQAYDRLEILEHTARISLMARTLAGGDVPGLSAAQLEALRPICG
jgi:L-fuculose-phosphate aldolase